VPAISIDRQCGSSLQALQFAAQAVMSGTQDLVVAAGTESMTRAPIGLAITAAMQAGYGSPKSPRMEERYPGVEFNQFLGAELLTEKYGFTREQLDAFALGSHRRAALATENGAFEAEIVALPVMLADGSASEHHRDEGIRYDATAESIGAVRPLKDGGKITPANTSQICDGASAALIASQVALKRYGLTPVARVHKMIVTAGDPVMMIEEPIRATRLLLERAGMTIDDIDLFEINEAFASVPLAWMRALKADPDKINVHGGAIALGHPLGASGTKLTGTLINALRTRGKRFGLLAICEGGGTANVMIVEAL
jgi:acetyl-CoA C-acetyltransferase